VTTPSAEMTKEYILVETLLGHQIFFICSAKFSYFVIFSASGFERLRVKECYMLQVVLFSLPISTISDLLNCTVLSAMIDLSHYKIMLADSSSGSGLYL